MHPETPIQPVSTRPPPSVESLYCGCALPIAVERAERHGAAHRACARCGLPIPLRWRGW